jgi:hypothetical protein
MHRTSIMKPALTMLGPAFLLLGLLLCSASCSVDKGANKNRKCTTNADCKADTECYKGFCVVKESAGSSGSGGKGGGKQDGGVGPGSDASMMDGAVADGGEGDAEVDGAIPFVDPKEGMDCDEGDKPESCFPDTDHPEMFVTGECRAGMRSCTTVMTSDCPGGAKTCETHVWSNCYGLIVPAAEKCNGKDDDCDGETDEDVALGGSCVVSGQKGVCAEGEERCDRDLGVVSCDQVKTASPEACNGKDDDCDDELDEDTKRVCHDDQAGGCTMDADGYHCNGLCKPGFQQCDAKKGEYGACEGDVTPAAEENCDPKPPGEPAVDEDCDGKIDESCSCNPADTYPCFTGQQEATLHAPCHAGTQACTPGGMLAGDCDGQVLPAAETCANEGVDDDCDGSSGDVPGRGDPCTDLSLKGLCRSGIQDCDSDTLKCITPLPGSVAESCNGADDDCDGAIDNGFNLMTDPLNCGGCGNVCGGGMVCCSGHCANTKTDANYCGSCGNRCGAGGICCNGACKNSNSDAHNCRTCGNDCTLLGILGACCSGTCNSLGCGG